MKRRLFKKLFRARWTLYKLISRVMRAAVSIPAVAAASVSHSAAVGGSVVGVVGLL